MITLSHPYTSPTTTLVLRNPDLTDPRERQLKTNVSWDMSGNPHSTVKTPTNKIYQLTFTLPTATPTTPIGESPAHTYMEDLVAFLELVTNGAEFKYIDQLTVSHKMKLISESVSIVDAKRYIKVATFQCEEVP